MLPFALLPDGYGLSSYSWVKNKKYSHFLDRKNGLFLDGQKGWIKPWSAEQAIASANCQMPHFALPKIRETEKEETALEPPYRVIIHNDDVTPMDFVMNILRTVFKLDGLHALQVMYTAHYHGEAHVQTLPKAEAVRRVGLAHMTARLNGYPLTFTIEAEK
jgi:ATP-dependent Clp protease adaptor protein ClpS